MNRLATQLKRATYPAYKSSGVEWLGEVPEGWHCIAVKRCYEIQLGKMLQNVPEKHSDRTVAYLRAVHVQWGKVNTEDLPEMWADPEEIWQYGVEVGDLLVCEGGEAGRAGVIESLPCRCIIQNALHRVRGNGADTRFLMYVLHVVSNRGWFEVLCNRATIAHFTREKLADMKNPFPPEQIIQRSIAAFLDRETARIDALAEKVEKSINLLREHRTALISAAVTGKINVNDECGVMNDE